MTPAETARSLVRTATTLCLRTDDIEVVGLGMHVPDERGRLLLPFLREHAVALAVGSCGELAARADLVDVAPVACARRERGRLVLYGWLVRVDAGLWEHAGGEPLGEAEVLLRLDPQVVELDGEELDVDAYQLSEVDPMAVHEAEILQHLAAYHPDAIDALAPGSVPLRLHRDGIVLRADNGDVEIAFGRRCRTAEEVLRCFRALLVSPRTRTNQG